MQVDEHRIAPDSFVVATRGGEERSGGPAWEYSPAHLPPSLAARRRRALRQAIVRLEDAPKEAGLAVDAGQAAAALAEAGDDEGLALILRADPEAPPVAWTVACYEIGHLTPSTFQDLSDPCAAVNLVGACRDPSHVAAELVVSTGAGLQWTALTRAGSTLRMVLPSRNGGMGPDGNTDETATAAHRRWRDELDRWRDAPELSDNSDFAPAQSLEAALDRAPESEARLLAALDAIEVRLGAIEQLLRAGHPDLTSCLPIPSLRTPT